MITRVTRGEAPSLIDAEKANEVIDAINGLLSSNGANGIEVVTDQNGALQISLQPEGAGLIKYEPFEVIKVSEDAIAVNPGTINNELVTPVGGVDHTQTTNDRYLVIDVTVNNDANITSAVMKVESSPPDAFDFEENATPGNFKVLIAIIRDLLVMQVHTGNITATPSVAYEIPKDVVDIGEYDADRYYRWTLT
tara:strand:+ start:5152 stop:5733 length:582 start_codon:yes stop_codon:yes gene_type:complete